MTTADASSGPPTFGTPTRVGSAQPFGTPTDVVAVSCGKPTACAAITSAGALTTTDAGGASPPTWSGPTPAVGGSAGLSCTSASLCVTLESSGTVGRSTDGGVTWAVAAQLPNVLFSVPSAVSCTSAGVCAIVTTAGDVFVSSDQGQTWSAARTVPGQPNFTRISCIGNGVCAGVDARGEAVLTLAVTDAAPNWTVTKIDQVSLVGLSCTAVGICVAVDANGSEFVSTDVRTGAPTWRTVPTGDAQPLKALSCTDGGLCVALDGGGGAVISPDATSASPHWSQVAAGGASVFTSIACLSNDSCIAGRNNDFLFALIDPAHPAATTWSSSSLGGSTALGGVSCAADGSLCATVDVEGRALTSAVGGATWSAPTTIDSSASPLLGGVSCVSAGCVVIDGASVLTTPGWPATTVDPGRVLRSVSCAGGGLCVAVDNGGNTVTTTDFGGAAGWSVSAQDLDANSDRVALTGVSCASTALCAAVDMAGNVMISISPATTVWSLPTPIDDVFLEAVSCTRRGLCVAGDNSGRVVISTNAASATPTWSPPMSIGLTGPAIADISCTASGLCVVQAANGELLYSTDVASGAPIWTVVPTGGVKLTSVSCADTGLCLGVDGMGEAVRGMSPVGAVALSATSGAFPDTTLGGTAPAQTFTLTNSGGAALNIDGATLTGADAPQFALAADGCAGVALDPGASCTFSVSFSPTTAGAHAAASVVVASDAAASPTMLALSGTGTIPQAISVSGGPGAFPETTVGATSPARTFTVTNSGAAGSVLRVTSAALAGPDAGQFAGTDHGCSGATLTAGASCSVDVSFAPTSAGPHPSARLEVVSDASANPAETPLSGTGIAAKSTTPPKPVPAKTFRVAKVTTAAKGAITVALELPAAGRLTVRTSARLRVARRSRTISYAPTKLAEPKRAGVTKVTVRPGKTAAAALRRAKKLRVSILVTYTATGGARRTHTTAATAHTR